MKFLSALLLAGSAAAATTAFPGAVRATENGQFSSFENTGSVEASDDVFESGSFGMIQDAAPPGVTIRSITYGGSGKLSFAL
jgi:hypothetical protein